MKINTALILCAGLGKRLNPLTLKIPKPLLKLKDVTMLENCINTAVKLGVKKIFLNTFHLKDQISSFLEDKKFLIDIQIIDDGKEILNTGGGILNMISNSQDNDYLIFNPDTLWDENYVYEIDNMQNFYFSNKLNNILLTVNKDSNKNFIYIGCQILNKKLFKGYNIKNFSISEVWNELLKQNQLYGFESFNKFYHLTNLETFKKLKDH